MAFTSSNGARQAYVTSYVTYVSWGGSAQTVLLFVGYGTGLKHSGAVPACFWTDFQANPSTLARIQVIFDDLGRLSVSEVVIATSPWPGTSQVFPTRGGRDSGRLGFSVRTWLVEAATAADLKGGSEGGRIPPRKKSLSIFLAV